MLWCVEGGSVGILWRDSVEGGRYVIVYGGRYVMDMGLSLNLSVSKYPYIFSRDGRKN